MKAQILELIARDKQYLTYCKRRCKKKDPQEAYNEFLVRMCEREESQLIELRDNGTLNRYCLNVLYGIFYNARDKFNYKKTNEIQIINTNFDELFYLEEAETNNLYKQALEKTIIEEGYWWNIRILEIYFECNNNMEEVARKTEIPKYTIAETIKHLKEKIKENYIWLSKQ